MFSSSMLSSAARVMPLLFARTSAMLVAYGLTRLVSAPATMLFVVLAFTVLLLPVEYAFARRIVVTRSASEPALRC